MMKEIAPVPIVSPAQDESACCIKRLAEKIGPVYKAATQMRQKLNATGLQIGRMIVEACLDSDVQAKLKKINSPGAKPLGGTDTKAHSYIARELSKIHGMNEEYLKQCARQYLAGLNKHLDQTRQKPATYIKGGVLKLELKGELPDIKIEPPIAEKIDSPKMETIFPEPASPEKELPPEKIGEELAEYVIKRAALNGSVNPAVVKGLLKGLQPVLQANGFDVSPAGKGGKFE